MEKNLTKYNLGIMIGEYIINKYLPVLDTCFFKTNNVIKISEKDRAEYDRLHDIWADKYYKEEKIKPRESKIASKEWSDFRTYEVYLTNKYLPKFLLCYLPIEIDFNDDLYEIKRGIKESLWESDVCEYNINIEKIMIEKCKETFFNDLSIVYLELDSKFKEK